LRSSSVRLAASLLALCVRPEEHGKGISAIGTALLDVFGRPIAISIPVPSQRFEEQRGSLAGQLTILRDRLKGALKR
jgi:DNA-binding IclR family transcriptional regulator